MRITLLGPQGCGKTTQAKCLSEKLHLPVVDIGELIRKSCEIMHVGNVTACDSMKKGEMVPDEYAANLLRERLAQKDCEDGFILDGYPRSLHQLEIFDSLADIVFFINIPKETAIKRLSGRGRVDDTPEGIEKRLSWYFEKTTKVLDHYRKLGKLFEVSGEGDQKDTFEKIYSHVLKKL